ncbi:unnamed protein product [Moneuplotes crassus]|uniref:Uncharacterized protein n=1 Tax=Euplotes crassus TaxID=5936 RepID=A0AAD1UKA9_EUPCR|nr:unnamed protein product [Moneuplotes crassus]
MSSSPGRRGFDFSLLNTTKHDIVKGFWNIQMIEEKLKKGIKKNYLSYYKTCRRQKLMLDRKNGVEATPEQAQIHFKPRKEYREYKIPSQQEIEHKLNMVRINHNMSADMSQMMPKSKTFVERATINNCSIEKHQDKKFKLMTIHPERMHNKTDSGQNSFRVDPMKPKTFMREQSLNYSTLSNASNDENDELLNEKYCLFLQKPSNEFYQNLRTGDSMNASMKSNHISSFMNSLQSKSIELKSRNVDLKVPSGCSKASKPKPSYTKLVHKLGSGAKVNVDNVIDAIVKKNMIVRTYRPDYSQLKIYETDYSKYKRKIEAFKANQHKAKQTRHQDREHPEVCGYAKRYEELKKKWTKVFMNQKKSTRRKRVTERVHRSR